MTRIDVIVAVLLHAATKARSHAAHSRFGDCGQFPTRAVPASCNVEDTDDTVLPDDLSHIGDATWEDADVPPPGEQEYTVEEIREIVDTHERLHRAFAPARPVPDDAAPGETWDEPMPWDQELDFDK